MKVNKMQDVSFQSNKRRYISDLSKDKILKILKDMDSESIIINKDKAYMLKSLSLKDGSTLYDNRTSVNRPIKLALFDVGKKAQLVIDTASGEILDSWKSFFSTWRGILKNVSKSVDVMSDNFNNDEVVKRNYIDTHC